MKQHTARSYISKYSMRVANRNIMEEHVMYLLMAYTNASYCIPYGHLAVPFLMYPSLSRLREDWSSTSYCSCSWCLAEERMIPYASHSPSRWCCTSHSPVGFRLQSPNVQAPFRTTPAMPEVGSKEPRGHFRTFSRS